MNDAREGTRRNIRNNLQYCLLNLAECNSKKFRPGVGVNASTMTRWKQGLVPHRTSLLAVARVLQFEPKWFELPHLEFLQKIKNRIYHTSMTFQKADVRITLRATEKWRHLWDECATNHMGTYIMYSRILTPSAEGVQQVAVWLLRIIGQSDAGIRFDIHNVDTRVPTGQDPIVYRYEGLLYPIGRSLFFVADEESGDEPFAMITTTPQVPAQSPLCGYFIAVGVAKNIWSPAGTRVVGYSKSRKVREPSEFLPQLGVMSAAKIPEEILSQI